MSRQATTSILQTALASFERKQRESKRASACFDVFPSKAGIEFCAVPNGNIGSRERGNDGRGKSRACRRGAKAEMHS
ncbi:hypothetical protein [Dyella mobilis]|uniref:hypothetical protein n=1 Tax=Dyella mobilis TaxID=1849582 RepID=UPI00235D477A|nr:hypothetical protein [Dyella mobilis]GLQ99897.1 hypothetical protein GCM10007863_43170 [Dyella mobilis]